MIRSGQITVTTAGTAVQAGTDTTERAYLIRAHPDNTGDIWIGNDGDDDVSASNGFSLATEDGPIDFVGKFSELWVDADTNGEKLCWLLVLE